MIDPRRIFADAYRVHRSCLHGIWCCVVMSVGVSVSRAVGRFSRFVWSIICTRVGPHGYGIVMCDRRVVR